MNLHWGNIPETRNVNHGMTSTRLVRVYRRDNLTPSIELHHSKKNQRGEGEWSQLLEAHSPALASVSIMEREPRSLVEHTRHLVPSLLVLLSVGERLSCHYYLWLVVVRGWRLVLMLVLMLVYLPPQAASPITLSRKQVAAAATAAAAAVVDASCSGWDSWSIKSLFLLLW